VRIEEAHEFSDELLLELNKLLPQLSKSASPLEEHNLREILGNSSVHLLLALDDRHCLGTLTLVVFPTMTGVRSWIEDVVVSEDARGKSVGKKLSLYAVNLAEKLGAKTVDLTSRPSRVTANELYKKVGFKPRETNVYRYKWYGKT